MKPEIQNSRNTERSEKPDSSQLRLEGGPLTAASSPKGWVHLTGWLALRRILYHLSAILGVRRRCSLTLSEREIRVEDRLTVFGAAVHDEQELIPADQVVSVSSIRSVPSFPLVAGAAILIVSFVWGAIRMVEGIAGKSASMVFLGLAVVAVGAVADILLFVITSKLFAPGRFGVVIHLVDGRSVGVGGVEENLARHALSQLRNKMAEPR